MKLSERIYRLLLRAHPRDFRDEYGREMERVFGERLRDNPFGAWAGALGDVMWNAPREHGSIFLQDLGYALRSWRRSPGVPIVCLTALAFGIGANTAIFSAVQAVLLDPLTAPEPDRLVRIKEANYARDFVATASVPNFLSWRESARTMDLAAYGGETLNWSSDVGAERLEAIAASASFSRVLGIAVQRGRWFREDETRMPSAQVVVLSDRFWRARLGADGAIVGRTLTLNGRRYEMIGVASPAMRLAAEPDLWVPKTFEADEQRSNHYMNVVGRLRPGVTLAAARAEMETIAADLAKQYPDSNTGWTVELSGFAQSLTTPQVQSAILILFGAVVVVLLIACFNIANLLLVRSAARRREIAIRGALGAGAGRIARQLLTEALFLAGAGGVAGVTIAAFLVSAGRTGLAGLVPLAANISLDPAVLGFAVGLSVFTGIAFGIVPLWHLRGVRSHDALRESGRTSLPEPRSHVRLALAVVQITLATLLLAGGGLLLDSFRRLQGVSLGFSPENVLAATVTVPRSEYSQQEMSNLLARLMERLEASPGIAAAGVTSSVPLGGRAYSTMRASTEDRKRDAEMQWRVVDSGYFRALQIPLLSGRLFGPGDRANAPRVFIISAPLARSLFGTPDAVGRRIRVLNSPDGFAGEVIGVTADVRVRNAADAADPVVYLPVPQFPVFSSFNLVIRGDASNALLRSRLSEIDPNIPAFNVRPMTEVVGQNSATARISTLLVAALAGVAVLIGTIGVYGVLSYLVTMRRREFGVRMAVGAKPADLFRGVLRQGLMLAAVGIATGLTAAVWLAGTMRSLLFEVSPQDPLVLACVGASVLITALAACSIPAWRASKADPLVILRWE